MEKIILCSDRKNFHKDLNYPKLKKTRLLSDVGKLPPALVIFDYRYLFRNPSFRAKNYPGKVFILYVDSEKDAIKKVDKYGFFDYFSSDTKRNIIARKIKRAATFLKLQSNNLKLREF